MTAPVPAVVIHRFSVSAERVFNAWLDVTLIGRWMFGPAVRDERIVRLDLEPRVGGKFSFIVDRQGTAVDHVGEYLEIDRPRPARRRPSSSRTAITAYLPMLEGRCPAANTMRLIRKSSVSRRPHFGTRR